MLGCIEDEPDAWLVERGVLIEESEQPGLEDLLQGDTVYRIRKQNAFKRLPDEREELFSWEQVTVK